MTICIAIKCKAQFKDKIYPCVLFAADTQSSTTFIKRSATKLQICVGKDTGKDEIKSWNVVVASSGDAYVAAEAIREIQILLYKKMEPDAPNVGAQIYANINDIGNAAFNVYKKYKDRGDDPQFEILLGVADEFAFIYHITCMGKVYEAEDYDIIGSGAVTGGELLIKEFLEKDPSVDNVAALATLIVTEVSLVDMYVGGEPKIIMARERRAWEYREEVYKEICEKSRTRWKLLKEAWKQMQHKEEVQEAIRQLVSK